MNFADLINKWERVEHLANDVGLTPGAVYQWCARNSIPAEYWIKVVESARKRRITGITLKTLAEAAQK